MTLHKLENPKRNYLMNAENSNNSTICNTTQILALTRVILGGAALKSNQINKQTNKQMQCSSTQKLSWSNNIRIFTAQLWSFKAILEKDNEQTREGDKQEFI